MINTVQLIKKTMHSFILLIVFAFSSTKGDRIICDADSDCFYVPVNSNTSGYYPAMLVLSCTGATTTDLESLICIADTLHIIIATCHDCRNHRESYLNDQSIMRTYKKLARNFDIDLSRVFIYGFSGMGVQAILSLFLHEQHFRGIVAVCAHKGAMKYHAGRKLTGRFVYLISREKDWNLDDNRQMHIQFEYDDVSDTLVITPGEHSPANTQEMLDACQWLLNNTSIE